MKVPLHIFLKQSYYPYILLNKILTQQWIEYSVQEKPCFRLALTLDLEENVIQADFYDLAGSYISSLHEEGLFPSFEYSQNVPFFTLGGKQFWQDIFVLYHYRIQYNEFFRSYRLLDPLDFRLTWGSYAQCLGKFLETAALRQQKPQNTQLVILLHGYFRAKESMAPVAKFLKSSYDVLLMNYPSTRHTIAAHASNLARVFSHLNLYTHIYFVTHSLGGIILRQFLKHCTDPRIQRVVMLVPPNQGSELAEKLFFHGKKYSWFKEMIGEVGFELMRSSPLFSMLPSPWCTTGVVAAVRGENKGYNPFIPHANDGVVRLEEMYLEGAEQLIQKGFHTFIMNKPSVLQATEHFLRYGTFSATWEEERNI